MLVAPYYNKPNQEGLYQHFKVIAESTTLPVLFTIFLEEYVHSYAGKTIISLSKISNIVAVKEASGSLML